jgi:flagellar FliJ protein
MTVEMPPSDRFKPIQKINTQRERKAATALGESLKNRDEARQRLDDLKAYLAEYLDRYAVAARSGISSSQLREYQVFISKLEQAIGQQEQVVTQSERQCDASKQQWRGRYSKAKAMDNAIDRLKQAERKSDERAEQAEADDRSPRKH